MSITSRPKTVRMWEQHGAYTPRPHIALLLEVHHIISYKANVFIFLVYEIEICDIQTVATMKPKATVCAKVQQAEQAQQC